MSTVRLSDKKTVELVEKLYDIIKKKINAGFRNSVDDLELTPQERERQLDIWTCGAIFQHTLAHISNLREGVDANFVTNAFMSMIENAFENYKNDLSEYKLELIKNVSKVMFNTLFSKQDGIEAILHDSNKIMNKVKEMIDSEEKSNTVH